MLDKTLAILGLGKIGGLLADAFVTRGLIAPANLVATVRHPERAEALAKRLPFPVHTDNREAAASADIVLLAVKPQSMEEVSSEIRAALNKDTLVISVLASVPTASIEKALGEDVPVVRAMPKDRKS